jgi:predicted transcriptional regulator
MQSIAEGLEDIENGRVYSAKQVYSELFDEKR